MCVFVREKGLDGPLRRGNVTRWPSFPGCPCTGDKMRAEMDYIHPELLLQPLYSYGMIHHTLIIFHMAIKVENTNGVIIVNSHLAINIGPNYQEYFGVCTLKECECVITVLSFL